MLKSAKEDAGILVPSWAEREAVVSRARLSAFDDEAEAAREAIKDYAQCDKFQRGAKATALTETLDKGRGAAKAFLDLPGGQTFGFDDAWAKAVRNLNFSAERKLVALLGPGLRDFPAQSSCEEAAPRTERSRGCRRRWRHTK